MLPYVFKSILEGFHERKFTISFASWRIELGILEKMLLIMEGRNDTIGRLSFTLITIGREI